MQCSSRLPSFGCFQPLLGLFWAKKWLFLAQNCAILGGHHSGPFSRHFEMLHGPQCPILGSKQAKNTFLSLPNGLLSLSKNCVFHPVLTHFWW